MNPVTPVTLGDFRVRLEPLGMQHLDGLAAAAADGALWTLRTASVPAPDDTAAYIERALAQQAQGTRLAFAVIDTRDDSVVGSTSYHDIVPELERLEIGWTWYARSAQRTFFNTSAKVALLSHAFDTLKAQLVAWRTDSLNLESQRAIERLGAQRDGVLRHHQMRPDGSVRDTVMYSMRAAEWPRASAPLIAQLQRPH